MIKLRAVLLLPVLLLSRLHGDETRYFQVTGPVSSTITAFSADGYLTWTHMPSDVPFMIRTTSSLDNPTDWADYIQVVSLDTVTTLRLYDPNSPAGMALIPAGSFTMGDALLDNGNNANSSEELPIRDVYVSAFYVDRYEVTQALWDRVRLWNDGNGYTYDNPGSSKGPSHPIQSMSWFDAVKWCNARSQMEGRTPCYYTDSTLTNVFKTTLAFPFSVPYVNWSAKGYRLPTEAEWEKAARGGATGRRFAWSDGDTITQDRANYFSFWQDGVADIFYDLNPTEGFHPNFQFGDLPYTSPGGSFSPNGYGVYDAVGNVTEWCWDWFGKYPDGAQTDPHGPASGELRVMRGGNWNSEPSTSRMASRNSRPPGNFTNARVGFRSVLPAIQ